MVIPMGKAPEDWRSPKAGAPLGVQRQVKHLTRNAGVAISRSVLDCASPLALSSPQLPPVQPNLKNTNRRSPVNSCSEAA